MNATAAPAGAPDAVSPPASRAFIAFGFFFATLVTAGLTAGANVVVADMQTNRTEKIQQVSAFVKSTQDFDPLVTAYMTTVLDGTGDMAAARKALEANIQLQHTLLGAADDYLSGDDREEATAYRATLVRVAGGLRKKTRDPLTGQEFAQGVADAAAQRERVIADLRGEAGLQAQQVSTR